MMLMFVWYVLYTHTAFNDVCLFFEAADVAPFFVSIWHCLLANRGSYYVYQIQSVTNHDLSNRSWVKWVYPLYLNVIQRIDPYFRLVIIRVLQVKFIKNA